VRESYIDPVDISPSFSFKTILRSYIYFLNEDQFLERKFKKLMRSQENYPKFLKDVLEVEDLRLVLELIHSFLRIHICENEKCAKGTDEKCSGCRIFPYCSMECHNLRWSILEALCKDEASRRKMFEKPRQTIMEPLMKHFSENVVSLEVFQHVPETASFVSLSPIIEEKEQVMIKVIFRYITKSNLVPEIQSIVTNQYAHMRKSANEVLTMVCSLEDRL